MNFSGSGYKIYITVIAVAAFAAAGAASRAETVRVGLYQNMPKVFTDEQGRASGIFIDLLDKMAEKENWKLVYVSCEWAACLRALKRTYRSDAGCGLFHGARREV